MHQVPWIEVAGWSPAEQLRRTDRGFLATLQDGTSVLLRPVTPDDKIRIEKGLARMSPRSIYHRFGRQLGRLSQRELQYFTEVDQVRHIAWGAVDPDDPAEPGLGIARLICEPQFPTRGEGALAVIDPYHGIGLGTILLATLCGLARRRGMETLRACVLPENVQVVSWFQRLGARTIDDDDDLVILDLDLRVEFPDTEAARRFAALVDRIGQMADG